MRLIGIFTVVIISLSGCSLFDTRIKTTLVLDDGKTIEVKSKSDAIVTYEEGGKKFTVDNRGRPGIIEQFLGAAILKSNTRQRSEP